MKRREILKTISLLPFSGVQIASADPNIVSAKELSTGPLSETNIFRTIGVEPLINCRGTYTIIGGSLERTSVRAAMEAASHSFVQYDELADGIGKKLAELTGAP